MPIPDFVVARAERLVWVSARPQMTHDNGDLAQYLDHTFRCNWVCGCPAAGDDESTDVRWVPVGELPETSDRNLQRIA